MSTGAHEVLQGLGSWPWYWHFIRNPLECLAAVERQFGPICVLGNPLPFSRGGRRHVLAVGAGPNRQVLGQPDLYRPGGQVIVGPPGSAHQRMRHGILAMYGDEHRRHRRLMQPPFARAAVASYTTDIAALIDQVIDRWRVGEPLDMFNEMRTLSNWVAANVLFGNDDFAASIRIGQMIDRWVMLDAEARSLVLRFDLPGTAYRRVLRHAEILERTMQELIARKRRAQSASDDVLSILIRAVDSGDSGMSDTDLIAHSVILYGASFETTASALAWTLYLIAQHPKTAAALNDEVRERLGDWPPDSQQVDALPLLDGVVRESMRLMPPVPYTMRTPVQATELSGIPLKSGDKVVLSHYLTHRDPEVFPQPNRFDPLRWATIKPDPYAYIPFSAGARLCLGYSFAMLELKLVVARVMQRYRLSVLPDANIDCAIQLTLRPRQGIPMAVYPKDDAFAASPVRGNIQSLVEAA